MRFKKRIRELIGILKEEGIEELEIKNWFRSIKIVRSARIKRAEVPFQSQKKGNQTWHDPPEKKDENDDGLYTIKSPMVGTFYRALSLEEEPFIKMGDRVEKDETIVCILEAMKLMNEIRSDVSGTIKKILAVDGQPCEFGQALFRVKPD